MADCPCKDGKIKVTHAKGIYIKPYIKPYKKPCDDCSKKTKVKTYSTKNIRSRRYR